MRYSKIFPRTRRGDPREAPSPGTRLLVRGGFIDQIARGIWAFATLGLFARREAECIVREEMNRAGAVELELPILHPKELWEETGRWQKYVDAGIAFHLSDRTKGRYILAPTAEEPVTDFARRNIRSYRDLPITFWQMSPKFRDELRPRQGLVRGREFLMKDAYSFDRNEEGMRTSYHAMEKAYRRVMERCGFDFIEVEADSGAIGGSGSAEFMALTGYGEDTLLYCPSCHYGGNQEKAAAYFPSYPEESFEELTKIDTPDIRTVEELEDFVGLPATKMVKTIVLVADSKPVVVSMRGDLEISEVKLANLLGTDSVETADAETVEKVTGAPVGFAGPINLFGVTEVLYCFDRSVQGLKNFLCGANAVDVHYVSVNAGRDFPEIPEFHDLSKAVSGQHCLNCETGVLDEKRGIELGHVFMLQQAYSKPMRATYTAESGEDVPFWMGCYGIGVSRIVQAAVEQHHDDRGIIWPWILAPFQVVVIPVNTEKHLVDAENIYEELKRETESRVLLEDNQARIGEKLTDAELLGWPIQVLIGREWDKEQKLEVRWRDTRSVPNDFSLADTGSLPVAIMDVEALTVFIQKLNTNMEDR